MFSFPDPAKSPTRHKTWCRVVKTMRADFVYKKTSSFLCSDHFDPGQIENYTRIQMDKARGVKTMKWLPIKDAVPSVSLLPPRPRPPMCSPSSTVPRKAAANRNRRRVSIKKFASVMFYDLGLDIT